MEAIEDGELDLTNSHLPSLEDVPLPATLTSLDLTANRLRELEPKLLQLPGLQKLSLRQNLISDASTLQSLQSKPVLRELDLRDNQLPAAPGLVGFTSLRSLDLSYNEVRSMAPLEELDAIGLQELYVANNKVTAIEALGGFKALTLMELGSNRIRVIENLEAVSGSLQELWLGRNRIAHISGMSSLSQLRRLSLQTNRLSSMDGLECCTSLEELYLSHNGIERLTGLQRMARLRVLDVSSNRITAVEGLEHMTQLTDLWLNDNEIPSLEPLRAALAGCSESLTCVYLYNNPASRGDPRYKEKLLELLPNLEQLDSDYVRDGPALK